MGKEVRNNENNKKTPEKITKKKDSSFALWHRWGVLSKGDRECLRNRGCSQAGAVPGVPAMPLEGLSV